MSEATLRVQSKGKTRLGEGGKGEERKERKRQNRRVKFRVYRLKWVAHNIHKSGAKREFFGRKCGRRDMFDQSGGFSDVVIALRSSDWWLCPGNCFLKIRKELNGIEKHLFSSFSWTFCCFRFLTKEHRIFVEVSFVRSIITSMFDCLVTLVYKFLVKFIVFQ